MADQDRCVRCGVLLTKDETALTRKLINRGATEFFCLSCLAAHFQLSEDILRKKIEEFKAMGCTLFNP
ncbi:hypothetical protein JRC49_01215 [Clostridiales bacterium FE2011]|nr:hypothetical protein JRC49_01215 [Clostridiales bacterium FE2011]QTE75439.1 hypothetical protein JS518_06070 [Clostridiales bacterium FE2010]